MAKIQFNLDKIKEGNFNEVKNHIHGLTKENKEISFSALQQLVLQNPDRAEEYKFNLKKEFPNNRKLEFAINQAEVGKTVDTLPEVAAEAFLRDNALLARINVTEAQPGKEIPLTEWDEEKDAENLTEVQAGNLVDDNIRQGDVLVAKKKVQASTTITELAEYFMDGVSTLDYQRRLNNRLQNKVIENILYSGQGVANGTARLSGTVRGIVNNYGVNGIGDANNAIGAIEYATKAAADALLDSASSNAYDLCYKIKAQLLPKNTTEIEENDYVYVMNRKTWGIVKTQKDLNGRYMAYSAIDPVTGKSTAMIDGTPIVVHTSVEDNFVFLIPARFYRLAMLGGIRSLNDNGLVQLREGITTFVSRTYIDGSMNYGFKYKTGTDATIGTTALDNQDQNAFRYFRIN